MRTDVRVNDERTPYRSYLRPVVERRRTDRYWRVRRFWLDYGRQIVGGLVAGGLFIGIVLWARP